MTGSSFHDPIRSEVRFKTIYVFNQFIITLVDRCSAIAIWLTQPNHMIMLFGKSDYNALKQTYWCNTSLTYNDCCVRWQRFDL